MDYNNGSQYGYDVIHTSPLMDSFDSPYLQVPSKMRDPQYGAVGTTKQSLAPPAKKPYFPPRDNYRPAKPQKQTRYHLDARTLGREHDLDKAFFGGRHMIPINGAIDTNGMLTVFIFILILIVVVNSVHLKNLTKQVDVLTCKNRSMESQLAQK